MESLQLLERDLWLTSLRIHKGLTSDEEWLLNVERLSVTTVDDNRNSGGVVNEVLGQSLESEFIRVVLNELTKAARMRLTSATKGRSPKFGHAS
jgi:hypothetical protein